MAKMYPSTCPHDVPPGEAELFRRLKDDPDTSDWIVLHSLDLARHIRNVAGEADFVVVVPSQGILVVEVKSHRSVHVDEHGWRLGADSVDKRGPFRQASEAMHSIRNYLVCLDPSFGAMLMWSAVCFPRLDFRQRSPEWHEWQVFSRPQLTSRPISRIVLGILARGKELLIGKGMKFAENLGRHASHERCEAAVAALRPKFEISLSPKAARNELNQQLICLTQEQFTALDQVSLNDRIVISAPAGAGKTVLAMEALRRSVSSHTAKSPALFCFNKLLGQQLSKSAQEFATNAVVGNFDAWLFEIARATITDDDRKSPNLFNGLLASRAVDALLTKEKPALFDFLILDEAQDLLQPHYLDILDLVLEGGLASGRWLMVGDFVGQDIFGQGKMGLERFVRERAPSTARFFLNANCRNTRAISEYVVALGRLNPPYGRVLRPDDRIDPELQYYRSQEQLLDVVTAFLRQTLASGFSLSDIVILSPSSDHSVAMALQKIPEWQPRVAIFGQKADAIGYTTVQAFKGLESPVVILAGFDGIESSHHQSLFYIGLSRALHRLAIFLHDDMKSFVRSVT